MATLSEACKYRPGGQGHAATSHENKGIGFTGRRSPSYASCGIHRLDIPTLSLHDEQTRSEDISLEKVIGIYTLMHENTDLTEMYAASYLRQTALLGCR